MINPNVDDMLIYPMSQHIGTPCTPVVEVGDRVLVGQKIADSDAFLSSPIHATVSGTVDKFDTALLPTGLTSPAIYIRTDGLMEEDPGINHAYDYKSMTKDEILATIRGSGLVGLGGAGFPTHIKLNPPPGKKVDSIIVNAAECEPFLTTDHRVLLEETERILLGLMIMLSLFPGSKGYVGIETNKMDGIQAMEAMCQKEPFKGNISVCALDPKYPQGAEKQLIYAITGREVPSGGIPADIGCIVNNVDTVISVHRALYRGRPIMRKIVTITGGAAKNPGNYKIRMGMRYIDLLNQVGGFKEEPYKLIAGGPMMGNSMYTLDVPMTKLSQALLCLTKAEAANVEKELSCIRCGKCVSACPMYLMPLELNHFSLVNDLESFKKGGGMDCIECGSCSFTCPSKRHLIQSIRIKRREVLAERAKK